MPIFNPSTSIAAIATSKSKLDDVQKQLRDLSFEVTVMDIVTESDDIEEGDGDSADGSSDSWSEVNASDASMK